jgi:hypothetical protein
VHYTNTEVLQYLYRKQDSGVPLRISLEGRVIALYLNDLSRQVDIFIKGLGNDSNK